MTIVSARYTYRYPYKWPVISFCFLYRWTFQLIASTYTSFISLLRTFPDWSHSKGKWYLYLVLPRPHCSSCVTVLSVWKWDPILLNNQKDTKIDEFLQAWARYLNQFQMWIFANFLRNTSQKERKFSKSTVSPRYRVTSSNMLGVFPYFFLSKTCSFILKWKSFKRWV